MQKTLGVVQVSGHEGLPPAKLGRKLGGLSLLELVVRRVTDCQRLDEVIVLADSVPAAALADWVPPDVTICQGPAKDSLANLVFALDEFRATAVVRVAADHPFIDPVLVDRLVSTADAHPECDYISYRLTDGRPAILTQLGVIAEWCRAEALRRTDRDARRAADRHSVTTYLCAHPEQFLVRLLPLPTGLDRDDLRLQLDHEEDWEHAQVIYEAVGGSECDWQRIADFLDHQPALRSRMAEMNRATSRA